MPGLGTIINVVLLVAGGLLGLAGGRFITPRIQDTLMKASGLCVLFIGLGGTMQKMLLIDGKALATTGTTMLIVSFALGSLIGEAINLEAAIENLGEWLKRKTGSEGDNEFTNAFVSTSLTVCIGAMAIVGSIQDGLLGDWSTLALKGALDCIIVCTMTASLGRGCIFSALPVAVFQGTITLFAGALSPHHDYGSPRQPFARRLHAHLLRRRQPHPSSDLPHGQYAPLRRHRRHLRPPVLNLSTQQYLEHLFDAVL